MSTGKYLAGKKLTLPGKKPAHYKVREPVEFFYPSLADLRDHLSKEGVLDVDDSKEGKEQLESSGLPLYLDETSAWIAKSVFDTATAKARGAYEVVGDDPETLQVEVTGTLPQSMEDLLASERGGGIMHAQRKVFLQGFAEWAEAQFGEGPKSARYVKGLAKQKLSDNKEKALPLLQKAFESFVEALENPDDFAVYIRSARKQFSDALVEEDEWADVPD